jgi:hypothetical protein
MAQKGYGDLSTPERCTNGARFLTRLGLWAGTLSTRLDRMSGLTILERM